MYSNHQLVTVMKRYALLAFAPLLFGVAVLAQSSTNHSSTHQPSANGGPTVQATPFVVHEWGTFTTLAGSNGGLLSGLFIEEEALPSFVQQNAGYSFNPDPKNKGVGLQWCGGVTLKMETPVIYFYSDVARSATVRVDWPGGTISQWYPARSTGDVLTAGADEFTPLDFGAKRVNGFIGYNVNIGNGLILDTAGLTKPGETHTWQAPRATDANIIHNGSDNTQVEKFLFYRGIGSASFVDGSTPGVDGPAPYAIETVFHGDTLAITNHVDHGISYAIVFERIPSTETPTTDTVNRVWWSGAIASGGQVNCKAPTYGEGLSWADGQIQLRDNLIAAGLYKKEADAMLDTWRHSYFGTPGLRVFWIVPPTSLEKTLPLKVSPQPDEIHRVMVARSEVLTPAFERKILADYWHQTHLYDHDRYVLAYNQRLWAMLPTAGVVSNQPTTSGIAIYPNPSTGEFKFSCAQHGAAQITILNLLGVEVAKLDANDLASSASVTWNAHGMPPGMYMCVVRRNGGVEQAPMMFVK